MFSYKEAWTKFKMVYMLHLKLFKQVVFSVQQFLNYVEYIVYIYNVYVFGYIGYRC